MGLGLLYCLPLNVAILFKNIFYYVAIIVFLCHSIFTLKERVQLIVGMHAGTSAQ